MPNKDSWGRDDYFNEAKHTLPDSVPFKPDLSQFVVKKSFRSLLWKTDDLEFDRFNYLKEKAISGKGDSDRHLLSLYSLALSSHSRSVLELGVRKGTTTLPLLMSVKENSGRLDSVDINDTEFVCPDDLKQYWNFHKSDAIKFLEDAVIRGEKFDFIYLDDFHSYQHVKRELELIDQLVSPRGIILIHDLMYGSTEPFYHCDLTKNGSGEQWSEGGPYRAVAELNPQFWEFSTLPFNNGLTLLRKKYSSRYFNN